MGSPQVRRRRKARAAPQGECEALDWTDEDVDRRSPSFQVARCFIREVVKGFVETQKYCESCMVAELVD